MFGMGLLENKWKFDVELGVAGDEAT